MTEKQQQFNWPRASKLKVLERAACPEAVKSLLKAIDGFAMNDPTITVTAKRLGVSMGVTDKTVRRRIKLAESEGLLTVYGSNTDGCANTYRINWQAVFDLPVGFGGQVESSPSPPLDNKSTPPGQRDRPPRTQSPGTLDNNDQGPWTGLSKVSRTDRNDKHDADPQSADFGRSVGDEKISTEWIDAIDKQFTPAEMMRIFERAAAAGLVNRNKIDCCRVWSLCYKVKENQNLNDVSKRLNDPTGYVRRKIEKADWSCFEKSHVKTAASNLRHYHQIGFTEDEQKSIRVELSSCALHR